MNFDPRHLSEQIDIDTSDSTPATGAHLHRWGRILRIAKSTPFVRSRSTAQPSGLVIAPDPYAVLPAPIAAAAAAAAAAADPNSDAASPAPAMAASAAPAVASSAAVGVAASAAAGVASPAAVAAAAAVSDKLNAGPGFPDVFLVEDIERRQGNVGDFLLAESDFVAIARVPRGRIRRQATR